MRAFYCQKCNERLFFENSFCLTCKSSLGFIPALCNISVIEPAANNTWTALAQGAEGKIYRKCLNEQQEKACTWMIPVDDENAYCTSCRLNRTIPDLSLPENNLLWRKMETSKRRLVYALLRLNLPVFPKTPQAPNGLAFDILADHETADTVGNRILTGHTEGLITLNLSEADDAEREKMRQTMGEVYRTPLGHFRHESGHYYWDLLVRNHPKLDAVRAIFGDERADYGQALQHHYARGGALPGWESQFVTPYAASHPWEDWAETWAHYLHILDTLETANAHGVQLKNADGVREMSDPYGRSFDDIREDWHALRFVVNGLNRSMGLPDPYPFILSDQITAKLAFIHDWLAMPR
ncbi:MAG: putative zinc-binding metallopeptidase [Luteolibacter sp.]